MTSEPSSAQILLPQLKGPPSSDIIGRDFNVSKKNKRHGWGAMTHRVARSHGDHFVCNCLNARLSSRTPKWVYWARKGRRANAGVFNYLNQG